MDQQAEDILIMPLPRWSLLFSVAFLGIAVLSGPLMAANLWGEGFLWRFIAVAAGIGYFLVCCSNAVRLMATRWQELRIEGRTLLLRPYWGSQLPAWAARICSLPMGLRNGDHFEVALGSATLEWVGKTLLLHTQPEMGLRLGRGARAEMVARWLEAHGFPKPVGR